MTWFAIAATIVWAVLLCVITVVQILYMESLRLRSRDLPALQFFKETLEDRIGGVRLCQTLTALEDVSASDLRQAGLAYAEKIEAELTRLHGALEPYMRAQRHG